MERKIGEIFEYNGEWYQCINTGNCSECAFTGKQCYNFSTKGVDIIGDCTGRTFKKLEKVGAPCEFQKRTIQTYKLYTEPFISVDMMDFIWAYLDGSSTIDIIIKQIKEDMGDNDIRPYDELFSPGTVSNTKYLAKEDMEEKKLNLKPFDLEAAKQGKPVCTRDGCKARIICFDSTLKNYPLVVLVDGKAGEYPYTYTAEGKFDEDGKNSDFDLMMLLEKKEGWVNIYKGGLLDTKSYSSKEEAVSKASQTDYADTIKIEWEE